MLYGARAVHRCTCYSIERAELQAVLKNHEMDAAFLCRTLSQAAHEAMANARSLRKGATAAPCKLSAEAKGARASQDAHNGASDTADVADAAAGISTARDGDRLGQPCNGGPCNGSIGRGDYGEGLGGSHGACAAAEDDAYDVPDPTDLLDDNWKHRKVTRDHDGLFDCQLNGVTYQQLHTLSVTLECPFDGLPVDSRIPTIAPS